MMGGLSVPATRPHCSAQYLGAYYAVAGPLCHRLCSMRSVLARNMAGHLAHPQLVMTIVPWAAHVAWAHEDAGQMIMDFRRAPWKGNLANAIAPVGKVVETAGVRSSTNFDRPERIDLDFLPPLGAAAQKPGGYRKLSYSISSLVDWGKFMVIFESADSVTRTRLLTHSGHGGVTSLTSDISCVHAASAETVRVTLMRISGSKALGSFALSVDEACPGCGLHSDHDEALERHITRCPLGAVKYSMHRGLAYVVARLLRQAGAAKTDIVFEVSNLRAGDKTRPGDVVWLHFLGPGQHLLIDVSITGVYRDAVLDDVSRIPGFAAKAREDAKLDEDFRSASPVSQCHGGRHRLVPFVLEEGGRFGDHALALLSEIAELGAQAGKLKAPESWASSSPNAASAYWVRKWKQEVSGWLQVTMSDTLLRQTSRASVYGS